MIKGSIPEFFPKVERADGRLKSKKEADASELLSSSSASSSESKPKSEPKNSSAPKTFTDSLRDARVERAQVRDQQREEAKLKKSSE